LLKVTREMVLKGSDLRIEVSADEYGEGHVFVVAPPDTGDVAEARALRLKHLAIKGSAEVDVNRLFEGGGIDLSKIDLASAQRGLDEARLGKVNSGRWRMLNASNRRFSAASGKQWTPYPGFHPRQRSRSRVFGEPARARDDLAARVGVQNRGEPAVFDAFAKEVSGLRVCSPRQIHPAADQPETVSVLP